MKLSIVVPCFNEEPCIEAFVRAVDETKLSDLEFVFVNDGSTDGTLRILRELAKKDARVHYVSFSRNFGKEAALLAGLRKAQGDLIVTMDADLQDPPSLLPEMVRGIEEERFDCVATRRMTREGEPPVRSWVARRFYWIMRNFSDVGVGVGAGDYRMVPRQVVVTILSLPEVNRCTKGIYQWVGFDTKWIAFPNVERVAGQTKWSFWKLVRYSLEGILAFSTKPLQVSSILGILCCGFAFLVLVFVFARALLFGDSVSGWPSLVCIIVFLGGLQLFFIGVLGAYLAKTYSETKRRPLYFIKEEH